MLIHHCYECSHDLFTDPNSVSLQYVQTKTVSDVGDKADILIESSTLFRLGDDMQYIDTHVAIPVQHMLLLQLVLYSSHRCSRL